MPKTTPQLKIKTQETQKFIQCSKIEFQYLIPVPIHIPHSKPKAKRCQQCISSTFILWVHPRKRVHILSFKNISQGAIKHNNILLQSNFISHTCSKKNSWRRNPTVAEQLRRFIP
jgi:hypothetical protein